MGEREEKTMKPILAALAVGIMLVLMWSQAAVKVVEPPVDVQVNTCDLTCDIVAELKPGMSKAEAFDKIGQAPMSTFDLNSRRFNKHSQLCYWLDKSQNSLRLTFTEGELEKIEFAPASEPASEN